LYVSMYACVCVCVCVSKEKSNLRTINMMTMLNNFKEEKDL
jgi:hypothetical protein